MALVEVDFHVKTSGLMFVKMAAIFSPEIFRSRDLRTPNFCVFVCVSVCHKRFKELIHQLIHQLIHGNIVNQ